MTSLSFGTNIGTITVTAENGEITGIELGKPLPSDTGDGLDEATCLEAKRQIEEYLVGERREFELRLRLPDADFAREVYKTLLEVPYGSTVSYKELATMMNKRNSSRAVGNAMKNNPVPLAVPCHRVIKSNGEAGGYSGGGEQIKKLLLELERDAAENNDAGDKTE